jgi:thymidine phosphorylase
VLDIKTGNGAFMKTQRDAEKLARSLINTAKSFNKKVMAFITDMNQPLGNYIGNWLEVVESISVLKGEVKNDLYKLCLKLAGAMIFLGKKAKSINDGEKVAEQQITSGRAFEKFLEIIELQGGDKSYITNPEKYPSPKFARKLYSKRSGYINGINNYQVGIAALELGAGRKTKEDVIDRKAGIIFLKKLGDRIDKGELIAALYSDSLAKINLARGIVADAVTITGKKIPKPKLIKKIIY